MPLLFQRHKPPELDQEIRALWRIVDRLQTNAIAAGGEGTQGPPGPPGETIRGTVYSWIQRIEVGPINLPGSFEQTYNLELPTPIEGGYTHLDAHILILRHTDLSTAKITIRGNTWFKAFLPDGDPPTHDILQPYAIHYDQVVFTGGRGTGRYFILPTPYGGSSGIDFTTGLAYYPVVTINGTDALRLKFEFAWSSNQGCFGAFVMGRYVVHSPNVFSRDPCESG